jgi:hypothetical protein
MKFSNSFQPLQDFRNIFKYKKINKSFYTVGSLLGFAAINYTLIYSPIVLLATLGLLVHELAHYFYAKAFNAKASLPIFLPLPFIAIAFVKIKDLKTKYKPDVAIAGMTFASLMYLFTFIFNFYHSFYSLYIPLLFIAFELLFNIIGSDGSKFRSAKSRMVI